MDYYTVIAILQENGWREIGSCGSNHMFGKYTNNGRKSVVIAKYQGNIPQGILSQISKRSGIIFR